jgi:hypothetical protein
MNRKTVAIVLLLGGLGFVAGCHRSQPNEGKIAMKPPEGPPKRPQGSAALSVHTGASQPFTQQDVANYFKTHNLPKNGGDPSQIHVSSLEFLTSKEVSQRLQGEPTGVDDNDKIGFATLTGQFIFTGPSGQTARFSQAYAAFDAVTGNLLMIGTLGQQQPVR